MLVTVPRMVIVSLPQVSLALGASKDQVLAHSTVLLPAQVMVGGGSAESGVGRECWSGWAPDYVGRKGRVGSGVVAEWPVMLVSVARVGMGGVPRALVGRWAS